MKADIKVSYRVRGGVFLFVSDNLKQSRRYARALRRIGCKQVGITRMVATTTYREETVK